jgi:general secretion pathway protein H
LLQSQDYGLRFFAGGYEFFGFDHASQSWRPVENDRVFGARELESMTLELKVDGRDVELDAERELPPPAEAADDENDGDEDEDEDEPLFPTPQVVIFSSGEFTPFELTILNANDPFEPGIVLEVEFDGIAREETDDAP